MSKPSFLDAFSLWYATLKTANIIQNFGSVLTIVDKFPLNMRAFKFHCKKYITRDTKKGSGHHLFDQAGSRELMDSTTSSWDCASNRSFFISICWVQNASTGLTSTREKIEETIISSLLGRAIQNISWTIKIDSKTLEMKCKKILSHNNIPVHLNNCDPSLEILTFLMDQHTEKCHVLYNKDEEY